MAFCLLALLKAIIERRSFMQKAGFDPEKPDDLLKEIKEGKYKEGQIVGITFIALTLQLHLVRMLLYINLFIISIIYPPHNLTK